jgi:hypothetical protein
MNISDYWRDQSRKRRAKARETGRCIICMTREARPARVTCQRCCDAATAATRRRRSALTRGPLPPATSELPVAS